jgi:hypothetical protein
MVARKKYTGIENKPMYQAMVELRKSNAAQPQDTRPNRERSRQDSLKASIQRSRDEE